jgi:hypothetical protein
MKTQQLDEIIATARAIQRKIAKEGTRPTHFVRNSLPKLQKILAATIKKAIKDPG